MMRGSELYRSPPAERVKGEVRAGLRYVASRPTLWISFLMLLVIGILSYNFGVTLPLFVTDGLHKANTTYTILYSVMSVGSVITALLVAHRGLVKLRHVIGGAIALGVAMLVLALAQSVAVAAVIAFFVGGASILYTTSTTALVQIEARPDMRGRVLALQTVLLIGTTPLGGPLLGWLADSHGGRAPLILGGFASLMAAGLGYSANRLSRQARVP
jgi:MFS family permease